MPGVILRHEALPEAAEKDHPTRDGYIVMRESDLERAAGIINGAIANFHQALDFETYPVPPLKTDSPRLVAIRSADPEFYMGRGEQMALSDAHIRSGFVMRSSLSDEGKLAKIFEGFEPQPDGASARGNRNVFGLGSLLRRLTGE